MLQCTINHSLAYCLPLVVRDPPLLVAAGGIGPLTDALADGTYEVPESLVAAFLYLLDMPRGRKYLRAGQGLEVSNASRMAIGRIR